MSHPRNPLARALKAQVPRKVLRDLSNRLRFGHGAPLSDMAIFPKPADVSFALGQHGSKGTFRRHDSGRVVPGDWDLAPGRSVEENLKLISCRMRWQQGADWEETPAIQQMMQTIAQGGTVDGCRTPEDLRARYARLDQVYAETKERGRLLGRSELPDRYRREHGGILVHVGREGRVFRAGGGNHRFAIARILDLPEMPAQLGVIHPDALTAGVLADLRHSRL